MEDLKKFKVLIVDDEENLRDALVFDFKRKGFTVFFAENGDQAFEVVQREKIDFVLSDIRMPAGDGLGLLERIRAADPKVPILVFLTGFTDVTEEDCLKKGALKVLTKPFDRKVLMNIVLDALGVRKNDKVA